MSSPQRLWRDALISAGGPVIWGSTYIVTTEMLPPDRPFTAAFLRTVPAGLILLAISRRAPTQWGRVAVLAALNIGLFMGLLFMAAYRLPGGLAAVVGAIQPLLVLALAALMDRRLPSWLVIAAAALGAVGMAVMLLHPGAQWDGLGIFAALAGACSMAAGTYLGRRWQADLPLLALTGWQLLLGGLMLTPAMVLIDPPWPQMQLRHGLGYGYLSLIGAVLAYSLWFRGVGRLPPVASSSLALLSPVTAVLLGWLLLGQAMTGWTLAGMIMVLTGIITTQWLAGRR